MLNFNGQLSPNDEFIFKAGNRAFNYGDQLFETIRYSNGKLLFWENHYFRMMGGACILRMDIPIHLNIDFFESEILKTIYASMLTLDSARVRLSIFRKDGGRYLPHDRSLNYLIEIEKLDDKNWIFPVEGSKIDVFHDHKKPSGALSNVKGVRSIVSVLSAIYAKENYLDEAIILNSDSFLCETTSSNIFALINDVIYTPPASSGCVEGIIRKTLIDNAKDWGFTIEEKQMKTFQLVKAQEVFLTNSMIGIQWVSIYKNKTYSNETSSELFKKLIKLNN
jgi:branched-chain amino acid aminotransferase